MSIYTHQLKDKKFAAECLTICAQRHTDDLLVTLYSTAIAQGFHDVAQKLNITKEELHKFLTPSPKSPLESIKQILQVMGFEITITVNKYIEWMPANHAKPNSLASSYPEISNEWDKKNNLSSPNDVKPGSNLKAWWICSKDNSHQWKSSIINRTKGRGCPFCMKKNDPIATLNELDFKMSSSKSDIIPKQKKLTVRNALATTYPNLIAEWHPTKNHLTPYDISAGSKKKIWWKCINNQEHSWNAVVYDRTKNKSCCPFCTKAKANSSNCLATKHPELITEWHPSKNKKITPNDVVAGSGKKVWWICSTNPNHEWLESAGHRSLGTKCQKCETNSMSIRIRKLSDNVQKTYIEELNELNHSK